MRRILEVLELSMLTPVEGKKVRGKKKKGKKEKADSRKLKVLHACICVGEGAWILLGIVEDSRRYYK